MRVLAQEAGDPDLAGVGERDYLFLGGERDVGLAHRE
jgi:hypothetical protein